LNNDRCKDEEDIVDRPSLTHSDLRQVQQEFLFLRQKADGSKLLWFRTDMLSKYKNHRYCEFAATNPFGCIMVFLDFDKNHVEAYRVFEIHNRNTIMMRPDDLLGVQPRETNHWQKYQIMNNLHLDTQDG
jgi:hypothetical protein